MSKGIPLLLPKAGTGISNTIQVVEVFQRKEDASSSSTDDQNLSGSESLWVLLRPRFGDELMEIGVAAGRSVALGKCGIARRECGLGLRQCGGGMEIGGFPA